jgi:hypothetical protein
MGDNGKSYISFNSLMQELSPFKQFTKMEFFLFFFIEMNQSETIIACGGHVC